MAQADGFAFECQSEDITVKVVLPNGTIIETNLSIPPSEGNTPREKRIAAGPVLVRDVKHMILKQNGYSKATFDKYEMIIDRSREGELKMIDGDHMCHYAKYLTDCDHVKFRVVSSEVNQPQEGIPTDMNYQLIQPQE
ncbi:uncharacterized protein LOC131942118 [Physella acuta]|uniref:uncharacterized protein LOC131942118 n=1 Tax=Physella acuta TaxID=109671 RepID=UPI0027DC4BA1|nr:uncharacterized protein LOC131942118 [Physella acuta]XP_059157829.1 uncharacterized protein LOC131942118 [Physella acuta]